MEHNTPPRSYTLQTSYPPVPGPHLPPDFFLKLPYYKPIGRLPPHEVDPTGLSMPYLHKYWFEDEEHVDDSEFYHYPYELFKPNTHQLVLRFLKQVRESRGYDVDCIPPLMFDSPYRPLDEEARDHFRRNLPVYYERRVRLPIAFAIQKINEETGRNYRLVEMVKVVPTRCYIGFYTFTAVDDGNVQTFQVMVSSPIGIGREHEQELLEWRIKG